MRSLTIDIILHLIGRMAGENIRNHCRCLFISQSFCVKLLWLECQQCLGCGSETESVASVPRQISGNPKTQLSWFLAGSARTQIEAGLLPSDRWWVACLTAHWGMSNEPQTTPLKVGDVRNWGPLRSLSMSKVHTNYCRITGKVPSFLEREMGSLFICGACG